MSPDQVKSEKMRVERAATQTGLKAKIYAVNNYKSIGEALRTIPDNTILVLYNSPAIADINSRLYILSKCSKKNIFVVTSSKDYSDSGAMLGILSGEGNKMKIVLNLKHSGEFGARFTPDLIKKLGIQEVIR